MRILFISANRLGDAVITCGVLDALIRRHPDCRITISCGPAAVGVYARMPNLERIVVFRKRRFDAHWLLLWWELAFTRWDLAVDIRGSALPFLVRARRRVVRRRRPGRMFEQHAAMLEIDPAPLPVVWTAAEDRARAAALLPEGGPIVGLGVTANWQGKIWPPERFAELVRRLGQEVLPGVRAVVLGGPGAQERALAAPVLAAIPGAIDFVGSLTVPEVAAAIQRCALFVGNDSGLMHLAAASGTPTIGLCGTTLDRADEMVPAGRYADWARSETPSMEGLSVDIALEACRRMLRAAGVMVG